MPDGRTLRDINPDGITGMGGNVLRKEIEKDGYDGIIFISSNGEVRHVVAWYPNQIKSALGNNGEFSSGSDITKETI